MGECRLCPRNCGAEREKQAGYCGVGRQLRLARASLHQWEEPVLSGTRGSGTVFFSGCSLHCVYCQNRAIADGRVGKLIDDARLVEIFLEQQQRGAHNLNLVTADHYTPQVVAAVAEARALGLTIPVVWNCSGYQKVETLQALQGAVDIWLADFKYWSPTLSGQLSHAPDYRPVAQRAVSEMFRQQPQAVFDDEGLMQRGVIVRHLLLPGQVADSKRIMAWLFGQFGNRVWYSLMSQYTPFGDLEGYPELARTVTAAEYDELIDFCLDLGMENAFIQEDGVADESFIPEFDCRGV